MLHNSFGMFGLETLDPIIQVEETLCYSTIHSIIEDHKHPFMATIFYDVRGIFQ